MVSTVELAEAEDDVTGAVLGETVTGTVPAWPSGIVTFVRVTVVTMQSGAVKARGTSTSVPVVRSVTVSVSVGAHAGISTVTLDVPVASKPGSAAATVVTTGAVPSTFSPSDTSTSESVRSPGPASTATTG